MPGGLGASSSPAASSGSPCAVPSGTAACSPPPPPLARGSPQASGPRRGASVPQKLAETLSSQYGLNVFVAGLLFLLAWAVHATGVGKSDLLCVLTALMLLQLLWMLWYVGRSYMQRRLIRPKDTHAGARWLRGECSPAAFHTSPGERTLSLCLISFPALFPLVCLRLCSKVFLLKVLLCFRLGLAGHSLPLGAQGFYDRASDKLFS